MSRMTVKPHGRNLRRGRYSQPGQIYHITSATYHREPIFTDLYIGRCFVRALMGENFSAETLAYVLMPDHFHWLLQLQEKADLDISVARVKSVSAHMINKYIGRKGQVWQSGFYDHALRKEEDVVHVARYIVANPLRAGLVKSLYKFSFWDVAWL
jgi:putative transposase